MARSPSICGVILAAGASSRMGRDKALLPWPPIDEGASTPRTSKTFLSAAIERLQQQTELVIVVAGKNAAGLEPIVYSQGASLVLNPSPDLGQFSSLRLGLQAVLNLGRDAAFVALVDRPPALERTYTHLRESFLAAVADELWAVIPEYEGRHGHPIVVGREMIEAFLRAPVESNARDVEHQHRDKLLYVMVDDPLVTANVNTPEDYARLRELTH